MFSGRYKVIFVLFLFSGFCALLYELVWIRMAYASFGVITPVMSVVVSVFMLGLSLGTWLGGKWIDRLRKRLKISAIILYAISELLIGLGAFVVPRLFSLAEYYLLTAGEMDSFDYLLLSALTIGISTLPWCILMGFTFPFMMAFVKELHEAENLVALRNDQVSGERHPEFGLQIAQPLEGGVGVRLDLRSFVFSIGPGDHLVDLTYGLLQLSQVFLLSRPGL